MVFVFKLFIFTLIITFFFFSMLHLKFFQLKYKVSYNLIEISFKSIVFNYVAVYLLTLTLFINPSFLPVLLILIAFCQRWVWSFTVTNSLLSNIKTFHDLTLRGLFFEKSFYQFTSLYRIIWDLICFNLFETKEVILYTISDIKKAVRSFKPKDVLDKIVEYLYELQKKFLKFIKIFTAEEDFKNKSDEEFLKLQKRIRDLRNPKIMFNSVRRLPWNFNYKYFLFYNNNFFVKHIYTIYNFVKSTVLSLIFCFLYFLYTIFFFKIQFLKQLSVWFVIGMMFFWLMSGFNFFLKRYQFSKFTSQIQRFWKRTNTCFWLIEGFLLLLFFYYYLNSSQEPMYMYDYSALNQEYLVSLYTILLNVILLSVVIYFMYFTLLRINSNSWEQLSLYLIIISIFIFFSFFIETYQFYYVISVFNERLWIFNEEENLWLIEIDNPILRTKAHYFLVCLIAKYWHFLFIFLSWVFFVIKSLERKKVTYVLFGANLQNVIILYALNLACYLQWFKWIYRRFFDLPYTWFFTNADNKVLYKLFLEFKLILLNLVNFNWQTEKFQLIVYKSLSIWSVDSLCIWKFI